MHDACMDRRFEIKKQESIKTSRAFNLEIF